VQEVKDVQPKKRETRTRPSEKWGGGEGAKGPGRSKKKKS